ncbi:MAG: acyltransferase domain-containing protein, partial [Candidatus Heimdallarchaeota archaeon]|nr:acyltransferase domain-containing protein [Candidatus Heimdallarchaeota archaeon]
MVNQHILQRPQLFTKEPIAIVGLGGIFPDAKNIEQFWENIKSGKNSIKEVNPRRWDPNYYFDEDRDIPDKTYTKIGAFIDDFEFNGLEFRIPPNVTTQMDQTQLLALAAAKQALEDANYNNPEFPRERTAVIIGNSSGGEHRETYDRRIMFPEVIKAFKHTDMYGVLPPEVREDLIRQIEFEYKKNMIEINEDSMPGELSNVIAGRIAAVFNLRGKNLTSDAACASSLAAIDIAYKGLNAREFDAAVVGGSDKSMSPGAYVKFSKIGALSPTGSYPFDKRANGFVMGEGAGIFVVKRLSDAIKSGDKIYALITGVGSSSDGKGKGITAPNPIGQELAIQRAFEDANINPKSIQLVEAHGTSTAVGDVVEVQSLENVFKKYDITPQSVKLGSIKSQIGHLKSAAGAAAIVKTALALHYKVFPPSINFETPNPKINWKISPFIVQTISEPWNIEEGGIRRAGVSSFGFGGTNFHLIMEEYDPTRNYFIQSPDNEVPHNNLSWEEYVNKYNECVSESVQLSAKSNTELETSIKNLIATLPNDHVMTNPNSPSLLEIIKKVKYNYKHPVRIGITLPSFEDTKKVLNQAIEIINDDNKIKIGRAKGIFTSTNLEKGKIAFVFPGQGSQYVNMLKALSKKFAIVNSTFKEADEILADFLDLPLSSYIFPSEINFKNENMLRQTQITQPAMLTADIAIYRLLLEFGIVPDLVAGHSLGEFAALVAAGVITFENALKAVAIRGKAMAEVTSKDKGTMASITGKYEEIEKIIKKAGGYVVAANKNSINQTVISGNTKDVENAIELFKTKGMNVIPLSVSAAFHTKIVEPAGKPLSEFLDSITFNKPKIPISSNVTGEFYPNNPMEIKELLKKQVGAPVEWTKQVESMYSYGANFFIEVGPKRALSSFVTETLVDKNILTVITNHPKGGDVKTFNDAVSAAGAFGIKLENITSSSSILNKEFIWYKQPISTISKQITTKIGNLSSSQEKAQSKLNRLGINSDAIVVTGVGLGLPGSGKEIFREDNFDRILEGQNYIQQLPREKLDQQLNKNIRRLIKQSSGNAEFHSPKKYSEVINLAGVAGTFDLTQEYMVKDEFSSTFDITTGLAIAAGLEALKDAGIPLIREYRKTTTGSFLPGDWILPEELQEGTGIIFASAFPGYDNFAKEIREYHEYKFASNSKKLLNDLYAEVNRKITNQTEKDYLINKIEQELIDFDKMEQYNFNRKLLLNVLSMGHAQFAQLIKAKGPNTQINAACASTTQAVGIATDWIRTGRCDRVIVISADDITSDNLFEWLGSGFLASGAASTKDKVEEAALPFDRRRGGMIIGMGAAALVVESDKEATRRGITPIVEILGTQFSNSSFHGTRLDVNHVSQELNKFMDNIEKIHNLSANEIGNSMMFMSHETYTPRRGGSASAEIKSLRDTFGKAASKIYIANTKGFTGHAMGAGIEDVVAIKAIEKNKIPPIANFKEPDPDLGDLQLSKGGVITVNYVLRLAAGFGSQIAFVLYKRRLDGKRTTNNYNKWLSSLGTNAKELTYHGKTLIIKDTGRLIPKKTETILVKPTSKTSIIKPQEPIKVGKFVDNVLSIVSDKTGYPIDMLDPNLDMEADLGIDTVKQAEIFGVIREEYNLEQDENLQLSNFPTIKAVAEYFEKRIDNTTPITSNIEPSNDMVEYTNREDISVKILEIVSEKTGYPVNMLDPQLDMEADLGIDTVKQAELFAVIRESWSIPRDDGINISDYPTLNHVVDFVMNNSKVSTSDITIKSDIPTMDQTVKKVISLSKDRKSIEEKILEIVSDKTGYPVDMLDPKLDMEADLGIDTVKQAELFGVIREEWGIERDDNTVISNYPTLNHVVDFVIDKKSELRSHQPTKIPTTKAAKTQTINNVDVEKRILEIVSEKTGYPIDMLDPQLDMEADLGIDTVKQAELFGIIREEWQIERDENTLISDYPTLNHVVNFVLDNTSTRNDLTQEISHTPVNQEVELMEDKRRVSLDENKIIEIISKYTGYPSSMIDTSLSFSTDLGIDSELFNTIIQEMNSKFSLNLNNQNKVDSIDEILKLVKPIDDIILEVT